MNQVNFRDDDSAINFVIVVIITITIIIIIIINVISGLLRVCLS